MKILNLYAGIGGNRKLWGDEHEITAVENNLDICRVYREMYPNDELIYGCAHQYLLDHYKEFDFIWASPPCPTHSRLGLMNQKIHGTPKYIDITLWQEIIFLLHHAIPGQQKWVVENVKPYYKPFIEPTVELGRHYFWANFPIEPAPIDSFPIKYESRHNRGLSQASVAELSKHHGIELPAFAKNKRGLLKNAVNPSIGKYILNQVKEHI
jgi:DNA (cytosine-5)-methyltransferase 1